MKIEDLVQLLNNRLREFQLSRDYAKMSGDLERVNVADKEVLALEDTLYQLNLLVDTSKSAAVKEATLAEVITDGSTAVLGEYDITSYATDPKHEEKVMNILSKMGVMDTVEKIDDYIDKSYLSSPVTGEMIMSAAEAYSVDERLMMAIMQQDSRFGTLGKAARTLNPGNVGNDDSGNLRTYESWQEGVTAVAEWLNRHRGETVIPEIPEEVILEPIAPTTSATSSPQTSSGQATSTPATATSTPISGTSTTTPATSTSTPTTAPSTGSTSSPQASSGQSTSTPVTATSTPTTSTTTPSTTSSTSATATTTPATSTTTPVITTSTTITTTTSSDTATSQQASTTQGTTAN